MTNKLTDSEIVKGLNSYIKDIGCAKCGFEDKYLLTVFENTFDLINRQQAENETLLKAIKVLEIMADQNNYALKKAKAEAYKECIEKAKEIMHKYCGEITEDDLDNLLKELVGDNNG